MSQSTSSKLIEGIPNQTKILLCIDYQTNWYEAFAKNPTKLATGEKIIIEQCLWSQMSLYSSSSAGCYIYLQPEKLSPLSVSQAEPRIVRPDFLLIRNFPTGLHEENFQNILIGCSFANVPAVNSLQSVLSGMNRPLSYAYLLQAQNQLTKKYQRRPAAQEKIILDKSHDVSSNLSNNINGNGNANANGNIVPEAPSMSPASAATAKSQNSSQYAPKQQTGQKWPELNPYFPLIPMRYYPNLAMDSNATYSLNSVLPVEQLPIVVKVGTAHAGYGKTRVFTHEEYNDIRSILCMHRDYYTTEPLMQPAYEYRIQKIAPDKYRGFKRNSDSSWKNNTGNIRFEDYNLSEQDIEWIDTVSSVGSYDILALDVLVLENGQKVILECNDSACGLMFEHEEEDSAYIRELVMERMNQHFSQEI
jgi:hypothetical protein